MDLVWPSVQPVEAYLLVHDHPLLWVATLLPDRVQGHLDASVILPSQNGLTLQVDERQCPSVDSFLLHYHPMSHTFSFSRKMSLSLLLIMYEPSCNIFSKTTSLLQSLKFQLEALIPNCNIPIFGIKQHKYTTEFVGNCFFHYLRFTKISTEISAKSLLTERFQVIGYHLVHILYSHLNHIATTTSPTQQYIQEHKYSILSTQFLSHLTYII